jgi:hypothetical protein
MIDDANPIVIALDSLGARLDRLESGAAPAAKPADPVNKSLDKLTDRIDGLRGRLDGIDLRTLDQNLRAVTSDLKAALPAARAGRAAAEIRPWLLWGGISLGVILTLLVTFSGGAWWAASSLEHLKISRAVNTAAECQKIGGSWDIAQGGGHGCWIGP